MCVCVYVSIPTRSCLYMRHFLIIYKQTVITNKYTHLSNLFKSEAFT